jgi:uncharacterized protein
MLYQYGALTIDVYPFNVDTRQRDARADFAVKPIVGAQQPREFMGPGDQKITLSGRIFPDHFGGIDELTLLDQMRQAGQPNILIQGDGSNLGWYLIERVTEHANLAGTRGSYGSEIKHTLELVQSPVPASDDSIVSTMIQLFS